MTLNKEVPFTTRFPLMESIILSLLLFCSVSKVFSQPPILIHRAPFKAIAVNSFTVFDVENCLADGDTVHVAAFFSGYPSSKNVKTKYSQLELRREGVNSYSFVSKEIGRVQIILDFGNSIDTHSFPIRQIQYKLQLGRHSLDRSPKISKNSFINQSGLVAYLNSGGQTCGQAKIIRFKITRIRDSLPHQQVSNAGAKFTKEGRALIRRALPEDIYLFEDITLRVPGDGHIRRKHQPVVIRITD